MNGFKVFDGMAGEYDARAVERVPQEYPVGFACEFIEWAGQLVRPLPVLAT